jgi:hypothetical protein
MELVPMKFFSQLFDSDWRERGDTHSRTRQGRHYESLAEQVMASRKEILLLQGELDRVSQDLAQAMVLNRTVVKLLLSQGLCDSDTLEKLLAETLQESKQATDPEHSPSRFCEDCGRPLPKPGHTCPYCAEVKFELAKKTTRTKKKSKRKAKPKKKKEKASNSTRSAEPSEHDS